MKKFPLLIPVLLVLSLCAYFPANSPAKDLILTNTPVQIYFSPQGGCTEAIVAELNKAKRALIDERIGHDNLTQFYPPRIKDQDRSWKGSHERTA
jgi:hypothetical protein